MNYPQQIVSLKNVTSQNVIMGQSFKNIIDYHPNNGWGTINLPQYPHSSKTLNPSLNTSFFGLEIIELEKPQTAFTSRISSMNPSIKKLDLFDYR